MSTIGWEEQYAIYEVVRAGRQFGFGNMIAHLQTAWAKMLMDDYGLTEESARQAAGVGMPFAMHEDLIKRGRWDETGDRYRTGSGV